MPAADCVTGHTREMSAERGLGLNRRESGFKSASIVFPKHLEEGPNPLPFYPFDGVGSRARTGGVAHLCDRKPAFVSAPQSPLGRVEDGVGSVSVRSSASSLTNIGRSSGMIVG